MDIDRPEDDGMEVEEPSAGIPIPVDESIEEVLQDDEVMATEMDQAFDDTNPITIDNDIELDGGDGDGDDMEPEPTPIPGSTEDPFFLQPSEEAGEAGVGDVEIDEAFGGEGGGEEIQEDETLEGTKDAVMGAGDPLVLGTSETPQIGSGAVGEDGVIFPHPAETEKQVASSSNPIPSSSKQSEVPTAGFGSNSQPDSAAQPDIQEDEYEDEHINHQEEHEEGDNEESYTDDDIHEEDYEEEDEEDLHDPRLDEMITVNTMPSVLLHLPGQPPKALFFPLDPADDLPDGISALTPVWFEGRHAELAQIPLNKLLEEIRREIHQPEYDHLEMSLEEKGLAVKLCQHDVHLNQVTLLEYLQVHYSCGLPSPVQLFVTFTPDRFWNRFDSIRKELVKAAEERKLAAIKREAGEEEDEEQGGEISEDGDEGYASGEEEEEVIRRPKGDDNRAVYEGSNIEDKRGKRNVGEVESAHPNADWATKLATGPLAYGIGNTASPNPRSREPSQPVEAHGETLEVPDVQHKGRSSKKEDDDHLADTTEASSTDSRHPEDMQAPRQVFGLDEVALKQRGDAIDAAGSRAVVPKDEIELLHDAQAAQDTDEATIDDLESTDISAPAHDTPTGKFDGKASETTSDLDTSLASSLDPATSGLATPPMTTIPETPKAALPGSSLANEVILDTTENEGVSMIPEDEEEEVDEPLEDVGEGDTYDDEDEVYGEEVPEGEDENGIVGETTEGDYDEEDIDDNKKKKDHPEDPLMKAFDDGLVGEKAAIEAVGEDKWEEYQENAAEYENNPTDTSLDTEPINPFAPIADADGQISSTRSTTVEDDGFDDEGFVDGEPQVFTRSKRHADDEDEEQVSSKRGRND